MSTQKNGGGLGIPTRRHATLTGEATDVLRHTTRIAVLCAEIEAGVWCGAGDAIRAHAEALRRELDEVVVFAEQQERRRQTKAAPATGQEVLI